MRPWSNRMADSEAGIALIILGALLMVVGIVFWPICGLGIVLLIVGIVLLIAKVPRPQYYYPPTYGYAPPGAPVGPAAYAPAACPVCGSPMAWIAQYGRWYCMRCQAYR